MCAIKPKGNLFLHIQQYYGGHYIYIDDEPNRNLLVGYKKSWKKNPTPQRVSGKMLSSYWLFVF